MDWKQKNRSLNYRRLFVIWATCLFLTFSAHIQAQNDKVWTQEEVQNAREGIEFEGTPPKPEKTNNQQLPAGENENNKKKETEEPTTWDSIGDFFSSTLGKLIFFLFIISLLVFTIYMFIQRNKFVANKKVITIQEDEIRELEDNLVETDIERYLKMALEAGNYKLAVRLLYLGLLQQLHESQLIVWKKEKTNRDYLREMRSHNKYRELRELTLAFDVVWYGDQEISKDTYAQLSHVFKSFNENIGGNK